VTRAGVEIRAVELANLAEMLGERGSQFCGQQRESISPALTVADENMTCSKIYVLDAKTRALENAQTSAVEQRSHEPWRAVHLVEDDAHLVAREHHR